MGEEEEKKEEQEMRKGKPPGTRIHHAESTAGDGQSSIITGLIDQQLSPRKGVTIRVK